MEVFICHLLLIFFRSAKLNFVAKGKGPFFAQNFKLVCDNYLDPLHLLSRKPEALCCTLIQCQLGTSTRVAACCKGAAVSLKFSIFCNDPGDHLQRDEAAPASQRSFIIGSIVWAETC